MKKMKKMKKMKIIIFLLIIVIVLVVDFAMWFSLYDKDHIDTVAQHTRVIVHKDWKIVAVINDSKVSIKDIPVDLQNALIASEDRRFYAHWGIDIRGIARAIKNGHGGGSTITQQLAKNMLLSSERSYWRKIKEVVLALKLEWYYEKDEILEMYLNQIAFGRGIYGIEKAAMKYFNKHARNLNLYEAALVIGSIPQPERFNIVKNRKLAHKRASLVLKTMLELGYISEADQIQAKRRGIKKGGKSWSSVGYRYLLDWGKVRSQLSNYFSDKNSDLTIITTLAPNMQIYAELAVQRWLSRAASRNVSQGTLLAMAPNGAIRAIVGGKNYGVSQYNRSVQAERQPGSAFKPFVYLAALMQGFSLNDKINDAPISINGWNPKNIDRRYLGQISLINAIKLSRNVATVRLMEKVGRQRVVKLAQTLGIRTTKQWRNEPGLALGTGEVRLVDLVSAYAVFANGGYKVSPRAILGIRDKKGKVLFWKDDFDGEKVVEDQYVFDINRMLSAVVSASGTGKNAAFGGHKAAGKTGTSKNYRDAWFIGYTAHFVTGVWVGNDDPREFMSGVTGGAVPARIFRNFMANVHQGLESKSLLLGN
jgi:penicillin-binding protein 1A